MTDKKDTPPETKLNIHQRILAVMAECDYVQKEKGATGMPYTAVMHDTVTALLHPQFVKHGICVVPSVASLGQNGNRTEVMLDVTFVNADDPADCFTITFPGYGIDKQDKGPGMATSYAYKYALLKMFALETGDDPDKSNADHEPEKPTITGALGIAALRKAAKEFSTDLAACSDLDSLDALVGHSAEMLGQLKDDLPAWYEGDSKQPGAAAAINGKREELSAKECEDMGPGRDEGPPFPGPPAPDETEAGA